MGFHLRNHVSTEDTWSGYRNANRDFQLPTDDTTPFLFESYWLTLRFVTTQQLGHTQCVSAMLSTALLDYIACQ